MSESSGAGRRCSKIRVYELKSYKTTSSVGRRRAIDGHSGASEKGFGATDAFSPQIVLAKMQEHRG